MTQVNPHGLHHVTAIATDPQANVDFYTRALGLRLVKQTVNFDAPDTYHLYYGDEHGSPSSLLTFFPWPGVSAGRQGAGMTTATAFSVPGSSLGWWHERFKAHQIDVEEPRTRDGEEVLTFRDPGYVEALQATSLAKPSLGRIPRRRATLKHLQGPSRRSHLRSHPAQAGYVEAPPKPIAKIANGARVGAVRYPSLRPVLDHVTPSTSATTAGAAPRATLGTVAGAPCSVWSVSASVWPCRRHSPWLRRLAPCKP